ncbi:MBL fold metallo-hydrolase [Tumebacillus permanentifrigoris]|uniref:Glyoxylase-like metal-dependent hydrolase (Beta-lactamase superfamily II) n=1 Tax=Tumebacillus permanentifrigoris TaxID=378543 RepID=A0A316DBF9_9BACL|nr:MBL fold metallo-hydrolase [Tumebacillus permanentifrigoris]PWK14320.1 glyoxylase-like metal-dependent hydrolase (beta-lactamase superfamily II) [Tumebacillus permanentifrigoris]
MAKRLETNVPGDFYVNTNCIDCDQCRQIAPASFSAVRGMSAVTTQPRDEQERRLAQYALLSCPTGAIGSESNDGLQEAMSDFPLLVDENIYFNGFTAKNSYGASSYLLVHPEGNWLIDSPRYLPQLVEKFEAMGGIRYIFLTHQDDVADAARYAEKFGAERIIHEWELQAQPGAEHVIHGTEAVEWSPEFRIIPQPGHTRGHLVLLYQGRYLFTGDHLAWDRDTQDLDAFEDFCWYSWAEQGRSMQRLAEESFEWVLPGHGDRKQLPAAEMQARMAQLVQRMEVPS